MKKIICMIILLAIVGFAGNVFAGGFGNFMKKINLNVGIENQSFTVDLKDIEWNIKGSGNLIFTPMPRDYMIANPTYKFSFRDEFPGSFSDNITYLTIGFGWDRLSFKIKPGFLNSSEFKVHDEFGEQVEYDGDSDVVLGIEVNAKILKNFWGMDLDLGVGYSQYNTESSLTENGAPIQALFLGSYEEKSKLSVKKVNIDLLLGKMFSPGIFNIRAGVGPSFYQNNIEGSTSYTHKTSFFEERGDVSFKSKARGVLGKVTLDVSHKKFKNLSLGIDFAGDKEVKVAIARLNYSF